MFRFYQLINHIIFNIGILPCVPYTSNSQIPMPSLGFVILITLPMVPGGQGKCLVSPFPREVLPIIPHVECCVPFSASMMKSWRELSVSNTKLSEHQLGTVVCEGNAPNLIRFGAMYHTHPDITINCKHASLHKIAFIKLTFYCSQTLCL